MHKAAIILVFLASAGFGQGPAFEVASIKPAAPQTGHQQYHMTVTGDPGHLDYINASLVDLIHTAYRVNAYQVQGPDWMITQKFDLRTKLPEDASREQAPEMLKALLAERFKLTAHLDRRVLPAYALVLKPGTAKPAPAAEGGAGNWTRTFAADGSMHVETRKITMPALAEMLSSFLGYPVLDQSGLAGEYDVPVDFSVDDLSTAARSTGVIDQGVTGDGRGSAVASSLLHAGLKLEARKAPLDVVVVDRLDKAPTGN